MFTLLVCTDVCGLKINLELPFERVPTMEDLRRKIDHAFYSELKLLEREGALSSQALQLFQESAPPMIQRDGSYHDSGLLALNRIQVYDDDQLRWSEFTARNELREYDQLYVFPRHRRHLSSEKDLPPPRMAASRGRSPPRPATPVGAASDPLPQNTNKQAYHRAEHSHATSGPTTPVRSFAGHPSQHNTGHRTGARPVASAGVADEAKVKQAFTLLDREGKTLLTPNDWRSSFQRLGIRFADGVVDDIFRQHASPPAQGSGTPVLQMRDFINFAETYPTLFTILHSRLTSVQTEEELSSDLQLLRDRAVNRKRREEELQRELKELRAQAEAEESRLRASEADLEHLRRRRTDTAEDEQILLDKELRVVFQREQLLREEAELAEATRRLDARSTLSTSHRQASGWH